MSQEKTQDCFAFLTVRHSDAVGFFGGLLTINALGRPVEFHCSLPIKPSRAQTILYGESLTEFLVGEQIAYAIVSKIRSTPKLIFTDLTAALPLRRLNSIPIACVSLDHNGLGDANQSSAANLSKPASSLHAATSPFKLKDDSLCVLSDYSSDIGTIQRIWEASSPQFNLHEPFQRIVEALREANPTTKAA